MVLRRDNSPRLDYVRRAPCNYMPRHVRSRLGETSISRRKGGSPREIGESRINDHNFFEVLRISTLRDQKLDFRSSEIFLYRLSFPFISRAYMFFNRLISFTASFNFIWKMTGHDDCDGETHASYYYYLVEGRNFYYPLSRILFPSCAARLLVLKIT